MLAFDFFRIRRSSIAKSATDILFVLGTFLQFLLLNQKVKSICHQEVDHGRVFLKQEAKNACTFLMPAELMYQMTHSHAVCMNN